MITGEAARHQPKLFLETGERWRPHRAVAAHLLWTYIGAIREEQRGGA
jgi:3-methyladenine DNA glycosylase/8-oxoguanine DNA glycosylase